MLFVAQSCLCNCVTCCLPSPQFAMLEGVLTLVALYQQVMAALCCCCRCCCCCCRCCCCPCNAGAEHCLCGATPGHQQQDCTLYCHISLLLHRCQPGCQLTSFMLLPSPVLTQYTFKLLPGQQPLKLKTSLTTGPANGIHVTVHQRRQGISAAEAAEE